MHSLVVFWIAWLEQRTVDRAGSPRRHVWPPTDVPKKVGTKSKAWHCVSVWQWFAPVHFLLSPISCIPIAYTKGEKSFDFNNRSLPTFRRLLWILLVKIGKARQNSAECWCVQLFTIHSWRAKVDARQIIRSQSVAWPLQEVSVSKTSTIFFSHEHTRFDHFLNS